MNSPQRLGIGIPLTDDKVHSVFLDSYVRMEKPSYVYLRPQFPGMTIESVRNSIVEQALQSGCTHLIMMDTDQIFDPDTITKLLSHDLPVCGAKTHRRYPPFDSLMYRGEHGKYELVPDEEIEAGGLVEVSATGTGCIMYKTEVFLKIDAPWFEFSIGKDGNPIGEDIGFCIKLKEAGYKIFVDTSIHIGHVGSLSVDWNTYKLFKKLEQLNGS